MDSATLVLGIGYLGAALMFSSFYMRTMIPLRVTAIGANACMITYAALAHAPPVLVLQACLLPLNVLRLIQMKRQLLAVKRALAGDIRPELIVPFLHQERAAAGEILFHAGEKADKLYFIQSGKVRLQELAMHIGPGDLLGEIGILAPDNTRTATAECVEDTLLFTITQEQVLKLYYQDPRFAFYLLRLITGRLLRNLDRDRLAVDLTASQRAFRLTPTQSES
jgi:CRP-like cAMP-binding protein